MVMSKRFIFLDHTADAKFQAYGKDLAEAFTNAAIAMYTILLEPEKVKPVIKKDIELCAKRKESLLYDFLEELLFFLDVDGFLLSDITDLRITEEKEGFCLKCTAIGDHYKGYDVKGNIKSITYNDMFIKQEKDKVILQAVVDL